MLPLPTPEYHRPAVSVTRPADGGVGPTPVSIPGRWRWASAATSGEDRRATASEMAGDHRAAVTSFPLRPLPF